MQRFCHRAGVGIVGWRQSGTADVAATLAPRDNHRRIVTRGRHGRVVAGYAVAGGTSLVIADTIHAHTADALTLSTNAWLAVADALHGHAAGNLDLSGAPALVVADALHAHSAENLSLTLDVWIVIQDAVHVHTADNLMIGGDTDEAYPLAGVSQSYPLEGMVQA